MSSEASTCFQSTSAKGRPLSERASLDSRLLGTWSYRKGWTYTISSTDCGAMSYANRKLAATLQPTEEDWFEGVLHPIGDKRQIGVVRLRYLEDAAGLLSNCKTLGSKDWGADIIAVPIKGKQDARAVVVSAVTGARGSHPSVANVSGASRATLADVPASSGDCATIADAARSGEGYCTRSRAKAMVEPSVPTASDSGCLLSPSNGANESKVADKRGEAEAGKDLAGIAESAKSGKTPAISWRTFEADVARGKKPASNVGAAARRGGAFARGPTSASAKGGAAAGKRGKPVDTSKAIAGATRAAPASTRAGAATARRCRTPAAATVHTGGRVTRSMRRAMAAMGEPSAHELYYLHHPATRTGANTDIVFRNLQPVTAKRSAATAGIGHAAAAKSARSCNA